MLFKKNNVMFWFWVFGPDSGPGLGPDPRARAGPGPGYGPRRDGNQSLEGAESQQKVFCAHW